MEKQPEVSIITINYNGLHDTCELIESIRKYASLSYELIVVDNASKENEAAYLEKHYPGVICIRSEKNLGFSGGNNVGIRRAKGKYILLLNNDTLLKDDSFQFLIETLESNPRIGAVSPKIKFAFPPESIQYAGYTPLSPVTLRNRPIGFGEDDHGQYNMTTPTPYLHGAAMMIKREILNKVGLMPEIYFLYYEELDWSTKMTRLGYELYYESRCTVYHKESQTTGQQSPFRTFYMTRNRLLYAWRNCKGISKYLSLFYQTSVVLFKNSFVFLVQKRADLIKAAFVGTWAFFCLKNKTD
ncbi:MAG: glycosyltransferase family 2 protein [Mangrovibacterium sp.]